MGARRLAAAAASPLLCQSRARLKAARSSSDLAWCRRATSSDRRKQSSGVRSGYGPSSFTSRSNSPWSRYSSGSNEDTPVCSTRFSASATTATPAPGSPSALLLNTGFGFSYLPVLHVGTTGTGFSYFPVLHVGATSWYLIAALGGNPYQR